MLGWFKKQMGLAPETPPDEPEEEAAGATTPESPPAASEQEAEAPVSPPEEEVKSILHEDVGVLFKRLTKGLGKTRSSLVDRMDELFLGRKEIDPELLDELEEILITADLGVETSMALMDEARQKVDRHELADPLALKEVLKERITQFLISSDRPAELVMPESGPFVIMVVGVNGVGKTTTIGKIAAKFKASGQSVLLIAADTFRAAAVEQLKVWGQRVGAPVVAQKTGADPSAVVFDGLAHAGQDKFDVIIVDTAGRLHTKVNLMEELKKIRRTMDRKMPGAPHEVMLVIDATTGQNGISQAREFAKAVDISGITLTKLDGTAKGGIVVNICREFDIPIRFIGVGEQMADLRDFDPNEFAEALFAGKS
ncbi:MAG: signal recognition particle-docking protein FtsY [Thermodesulfobacteriota bacterium]